MTCSHCRHDFVNLHPDDHPDQCCDCFDLHNGKPLDLINERRAERGQTPIPQRAA